MNMHRIPSDDVYILPEANSRQPYLPRAEGENKDNLKIQLLLLITSGIPR